MATQQEYDELLRKAKSKVAKDWEVEALARAWWNLSGSFGDDVRRTLTELRRSNVYGAYGTLVDGVLRKLGK